MEELDLLKKAWKRDQGFESVSEQQIYAMLHRRSSSIVKWILIISILEIALWTGLGLCLNSDEMLKSGPHWLTRFYTAVTYINYAVVAVFIFLFYRNYVAISTTHSVRRLMADILKTRKTVQYYVAFQLTMGAVGCLIGIELAYTKPELADEWQVLTDGNHPVEMTVMIVTVVFFLAIAAFLFWLFYRLVYGTLMRRLYRNYSELKRIDTL